MAYAPAQLTAPPVPAPTLLLFDIDGTILHAHGTGREAVDEALRLVLGGGITSEGVSFSGKTDPQIFREILHRAERDVAPATFPALLDAYSETMRTRLTPDRVTLLPGVATLIEALHGQENIHLALLTGNLQPMAYLKLDMVGLVDFFPFGAFGSDHEDRYQLPPVAVSRAKLHTGHAFAGDRVVIIGDTEHDLCCGRAIGARAVGVCTGRYSRAALEIHAPHLLLDDFSDPAPLLALLEGS